MFRNQVSLFIVTFLICGFFFLASPEVGFSGMPPIEVGCCQLEGSCSDTSEGPIICRTEDFIEGALCNDDIGLCTQESNIPTLSEWGLIAMAGVLGVIGLIVAARRRKAAV